MNNDVLFAFKESRCRTSIQCVPYNITAVHKMFNLYKYYERVKLISVFNHFHQQPSLLHVLYFGRTT